VWQREQLDTWFATFKSTRLVDHFDGEVFEVPDSEIKFEFAAADRIQIRGLLNWLPIWTTNNEVEQFFGRYGEVKQVSHAREGGIATGVREVTITMREGEQRSLPYIGRLHGERFLFVVPGRPPVCFRCEETGHIRQNCPAYFPSGNKSYASAVRTAVGRPTPAERSGETTKQAAVGRPDPDVGKPGDETGAIGTPQDGYRRSSRMRNPKVRRSLRVTPRTKKWEGALRRPPTLTWRHPLWMNPFIYTTKD
jgi:hypothetical protein